MAFKLSNVDCENIVRNKRDKVKEIHLAELKRLTDLYDLAETLKDFTNIQGRVKQQKSIIGLYEKAFSQLKK